MEYSITKKANNFIELLENNNIYNCKELYISFDDKIIKIDDTKIVINEIDNIIDCLNEIFLKLDNLEILHIYNGFKEKININNYPKNLKKVYSYDIELICKMLNNSLNKENDTIHIKDLEGINKLPEYIKNIYCYSDFWDIDLGYDTMEILEEIKLKPDVKLYLNYYKLCLTSYERN